IFRLFRLTRGSTLKLSPTMTYIFDLYLPRKKRSSSSSSSFLPPESVMNSEQGMSRLPQLCNTLSAIPSPSISRSRYSVSPPPGKRESIERISGFFGLCLSRTFRSSVQIADPFSAPLAGTFKIVKTTTTYIHGHFDSWPFATRRVRNDSFPKNFIFHLSSRNPVY